MIDLVFFSSSAPNRGVRLLRAGASLAGVLLIASAAGLRANEPVRASGDPGTPPVPPTEQQVQQAFDLAYNLDH